MSRKETKPGELAQNTPLYVTGVSNVRSFLKWLKDKTVGDGRARKQGDKLILVSGIADLFRATMKMLRSKNPKTGVAFYI